MKLQDRSAHDEAATRVTLRLFFVASPNNFPFLIIEDGGVSERQGFALEIKVGGNRAMAEHRDQENRRKTPVRSTIASSHRGIRNALRLYLFCFRQSSR